MRNKKRLGLKWRVYLAFTGFVLFAIAILWILHTFFLDTIYQQIKVTQIKTVAAQLKQSVDGDIELEIANAAEKSGLCIHVFDGYGRVLGSAGTRPFCIVRSIQPEHLTHLVDKARESGGSYFAKMEEKISNGFSGSNRDLGHEHSKRRSVGYFMVQVAHVTAGERVIIIDAAMAPLDITVSTLQYTLIITTVIAVLVALFIAVLLARQISKPIEEINRRAKGLASGKFEYNKGKNYPEIDELAHTLKDAAVEISRTDDLKRELFANVSHDLRTPLTMITGYAEVMRDIPGENTPQNVQVVIDEANRLTRLVNDMLDLSRLQSITSFEPERFNLTALIRQILARYNKLRELEGYTVELIADGDAYVNADELRISQVVYNLINNAIDFTGKDKKVTVKQTCLDGRVRIEVIDSGEGIDQDKLQHIWERYYKVDKEHKRSRVGTGLGLSIVKEALEIHKASFGVISGEGGSTFWFELDALEAEK